MSLPAKVVALLVSIAGNLCIADVVDSLGLALILVCLWTFMVVFITAAVDEAVHN